MKIITQDCVLVDLDHFAKVEMYVGEVESTEVYLIISSETFDDKEEDGILLGTYNDEVECEESFNALVNAVSEGQPIFQMPEPAIKEVTPTTEEVTE